MTTIRAGYVQRTISMREKEIASTSEQLKPRPHPIVTVARRNEGDYALELPCYPD